MKLFKVKYYDNILLMSRVVDVVAENEEHAEIKAKSLLTRNQRIDEVSEVEGYEQGRTS